MFRAFISIWLGLVVVHLSSLWEPVYWDTILGSFHQAIWLKENSFDWWRLCSEMPAYFAGGPKVYAGSVYPLVQAVLLKLLGTSVTFLVDHLAQLALAAGSVVLLYRILRRVCSNGVSLMLSAVWVSLPLFHSMAATINMDLPVAFFSLLAVSFFLEKNRSGCLAALSVALLIKSTAAIAFIGLVLVFCLCRLRSRADLKWVFGFGVVAPLLFANQFFQGLGPEALNASEMEIALSNWLFAPYRIISAAFNQIMVVPDLMVLMILAFGIAVLWLFMVVVENSSVSIVRWGKGVLMSLERNEEILLCSLLVIGFTLMYFAINIPLPRYQIWLIPYELVFLSFFVERLVPRKTLVVVLSLVVVVNAINHWGHVYRWLSDRELHGFGALRERSMEYRSDLICNQKLAEVAEQELKEVTIVTCWPFTHILAAPEFGYVKEPLDVVSVNMAGLPALGVPHISDWAKSKENQGKTVVYISTIGNFFGPLQFDPKQHRKLGEVAYKDRSVILFTKMGSE